MLVILRVGDRVQRRTGRSVGLWFGLFVARRPRLRGTRAGRGRAGAVHDLRAAGRTDAAHADLSFDAVSLGLIEFPGRDQLDRQRLPGTFLVLVRVRLDSSRDSALDRLEVVDADAIAVE